MTTTTPRRGGRGARDRILAAATRLFYEEGINATGVARLAEVAEVSTRTFYQHFPSKNALVEAYLARVAPPAEQELERTDLPARERLLAIFTSAGTPAKVARGCPFHNAAVEAADTVPEVRALVIDHKKTFTRRLVDTAAEAGARDPERLGRQLSVLFEGARALATSCADPAKIDDAREAAEVLVDLALAPE